MKERFKQFYMDVAQRTAELSRAKRLQGGSLVVKNDSIISYGYNGTPSGWDNECENVIGYGIDGKPVLKTRPEVLHSEMNCLMKLAKGSGSGAGASMFITHKPCLDCAKGIYQAGITSVYYRDNYKDDYGVDFLKGCGVTVEQVGINIPEL
jgi:dCMP deaminase